MTKRARSRFAAAMEECATCASGTDGTAGGAAQVGGSEFTYRDNEGRKDLIVMTGPLSEVCTKALGVYFAKTDISASDDGEGEVVQEVPAAETIVNDMMMEKALLEAASNRNIFERASSRLLLVNQYDDFDEPPCAQVMTVTTPFASSPETMEAVGAAVEVNEKHRRDTVLFVDTVPDVTGVSGPMTEGMQTEIIDTNAPDVPVDSFEEITSSESQMALESLYAGKGVKVVFGMEGLARWMYSRFVVR